MKAPTTRATQLALSSAVAIFLLQWAPVAHGQANWTGTIGSWDNAGNWDINGVPEAFDTPASIDNGGVANVDGAVAEIAPTILLGNGPNNGGTLNINGPSGSLATANQGSSSGNVEVGLNTGTGTVNVASGGTLTVAGELRADTNASSASTISVADGGTIDANSAFLDRTLILTGPNANLSTTGNLTLGLAGTHTWQIPVAGSPILNVGSELDLGGTLRLEFPGQTPTVGTSWTLADSASVVNGFSNVDTSGIPGLENGETFVVATTPDGSSTNGQLTKVTLEQYPVLIVNRQSGQTTLSNPGSVTSVDFDAYTIGSELGNLNPGSWNSLENNSVGSWVEANPSATALSELETISSTSLVAGGSIDFGTPVAFPTPTEFGQQVEDIRFQFAANNGDYVDGEVRYTGTPTNTLVLNVDPTSGETHLWNPTAFTVDFDAYTISSKSGSLQAGDGNWSSLQDQAAADGSWSEANPDANDLSELQTIGVTTLSTGTAFNLGTPFDTSGKKDLVFEFALDGESEYREGIVVYEEFVGLPEVLGDYNNSGQVEQGDLDLVILNWGATLPPPITGWVNQQPDDGNVGQNDLDGVLSNWANTSATAAAAAVPEPASSVMLLSLAIASLAFRHRRDRSAR